MTASSAADMAIIRACAPRFGKPGTGIFKLDDNFATFLRDQKAKLITSEYAHAVVSRAVKDKKESQTDPEDLLVIREAQRRFYTRHGGGNDRGVTTEATPAINIAKYRAALSNKDTLR